MNNKYLIALIVLIALGVIAAFVFIPKSSNKSQQSNTDEVQVVTPEIPVKLIISKLNIDTNIESVGLDVDSAMDVPKDPQNVAWYNLGYYPGQVGNAVISGHFDDPNGNPAVFYDLITLKPGDEIKTIDAKNKEKSFIVAEVKTYSYMDFPLLEVFGAHNLSRLNLITCWGKWDAEQKTYLERVVVYSELAPQ